MREPTDLLMYCMHALRRPEVREYVVSRRNREIEERGSRVSGIWNSILEAFEVEWEPAKFYGEFGAAGAEHAGPDERERSTGGYTSGVGMGHLIEYLAAVPEQRVRNWVGGLRGFFLPEPLGVNFDWEGSLSSDGDFWAHARQDVTKFVLAAKDSWLFNGHPPTLDFAHRFEREFWREVGPFPLVRFDELLRSNWEQETGREWWQMEKPLESLLDWLGPHEQTHWQMLPPPGRTP